MPSDVEKTEKVIAIQGTPISSTGPVENQVLAYDGMKWSPAYLPENPLNGYGLNEFSGTGAIVKSIATESILASTSNANLKYFTMDFVGNNSNLNSVINYSNPTGIQNWNISVIGMNKGAAKDFYKSDLNFLTTNNDISVSSMFPTGPVENNIISGGLGGSWKSIATTIANNTNIFVQGATGTTWSISGTIQGLSMVGGSDPIIPSDLSGLVVWLSTDSGITLSGSNVSNWTDRSPENNDVSQYDSGLQPTFNSSDSDFNNLPSISVNGSQYMDTSGLNTYNQPNTIIFCGLWNSFSVDNMLVGSMDGFTRNDLFAHTSTSPGIFAGGSIFGESIDMTNPLIIGGIFNGSESSIFINNAQLPVSVGNIGSENWSALEVGGTLQGTNGGDGKISEIVAYNRVLSNNELRKIFKYLGNKYAISVS